MLGEMAGKVADVNLLPTPLADIWALVGLQQRRGAADIGKTQIGVLLPEPVRRQIGEVAEPASRWKTRRSASIFSRRRSSAASSLARRSRR